MRQYSTLYLVALIYCLSSNGAPRVSIEVTKGVVADPACLSALKEMIAGNAKRGKPKALLFPPEILQDPDRLYDALLKSGVTKTAAKAVCFQLEFLLKADADPKIGELVKEWKSPNMKKGFHVCLVGGKCVMKRLGEYVSNVEDFNVGRVYYQGNPEKDNHVGAEDEDLPPGFHAFTLYLQKLNPSRRGNYQQEADVIWVKMLSHEIQHRLNLFFIRKWVKAIRWLEKSGHKAELDSLAKDYVRTDNGVTVVDLGFMTVLEESLATQTHIEVGFYFNKHGDPEWEKKKGDKWLKKAVADQVEDLSGRKCLYGDSARLAMKGLKIGDETIPVTEANFIEVGIRMWDIMKKTITTAEQLGFKEE